MGNSSRITKNIEKFHAYLHNGVEYLLADSPKQTGIYILTLVPAGGGPAPAAPPSPWKNWHRLWLTEGEMLMAQTLRTEEEPLYVSYSEKEQTRTTAIKDNLRDVQKRFSDFFRPILNRMEGNPQATIDDFHVFNIKAAALVDKTKTEEHGSHLVTGPPLVGLKNMGGAMLDVLIRRKSDKDRPSMLDGFMVELRWWVLEKTEAPPTDPDQIGHKTELSSKAHFQVSAGMPNLGKTFYCYIRWRHKTNPAILSPWTNRMQIVVA